jgi:hypothetical protein
MAEDGDGAGFDEKWLTMIKFSSNPRIEPGCPGASD